MKGFHLLVLALFIVITGCDPGMTIYQGAGDQNALGNKLVTIQVKANHPLIGETWYAPDRGDATITNLVDRRILVEKVELVANGTIYQNKPAHLADDYLLKVEVGKTENLPLWFDLKDPVDEAFKEPAELRVWVKYGAAPSIVMANAYIVGGPLDMKTP